MKLEEYLEELFEELFREAKEQFHYDIRYAAACADKERIELEWEERYSQQEREYLKECLTAYRTSHLEQERFLYRQGIQDCVALLKNLNVLA